jgi:hypothetical protein
MFYERGWLASANVYNGQIYVIGGWDASSGSISNVIAKPEKYDPVENSWTELADMPVPVTGHISLVYKDKIYVFGGDSLYTMDGSKSTNIIQEYDTSTDTWSLLPGMPFTRSQMTGQRVGNFVYLFGGCPDNTRSYSSVLPEVWRFDLESPNTFIPVTGISLYLHSLELYVDEAVPLIATVTPEFATNPSVSWSSSDQGIATVNVEGMVTGVALGQTYICATTNDGNFKYSCLVTVVIDNTGITDTRANRLSIFPNPTYDLLTIQTEQPGQRTIEITSLNGQLIYSTEMEGTTHRIDLSSYQKGVYLITIRNKDFVTTRKIVKL